MNEAIWKRVYRCAQELTEKGVTPFTRSDLVRCVQYRDPGCSETSINPIIQGLTDNLRGGASGAAGKNLLHRVGRGQFLLNEDAQINLDRNDAAEVEVSPAGHSKSFGKEGDAQVELGPGVGGQEYLELGGYSFRFICRINPEQGANDVVRPFRPQDRYENPSNLKLHKYGGGPFCKFKIPRNLEVSGVYVLVVDGEVRYVGECENFSKRFNMGYGNISPRNCFEKGQETNCRINSRIFECASSGAKLTLWFHATNDYKRLEAELRKLGAFEWNRA